jgi:mono/diheme cytochrome c family protein
MKNKFFLLLFILTVNTINVKADPPTDEGKNIFTTRCAACHNINRAMTGPALAGVDQRRPIDWIINFVHSSQSVVKSGDVYAVALFEKFSKVTMPDHRDLTTDNIKNIVAYIKSESKINTGEKAPFAKPSVKRPYYIPLSIHSNYLFFIGYFVVVIMLIVALLLAVHSTSFRLKMRGK